MKLTQIPLGPYSSIISYVGTTDSLSLVCKLFEGFAKSFYTMRYSALKKHFFDAKRISKFDDLEAWALSRYASDTGIEKSELPPREKAWIVAKFICQYTLRQIKKATILQFGFLERSGLPPEIAQSIPTLKQVWIEATRLKPENQISQDQAFSLFPYNLHNLLSNNQGFRNIESHLSLLDDLFLLTCLQGKESKGSQDHVALSPHKTLRGVTSFSDLVQKSQSWVEANHSQIFSIEVPSGTLTELPHSLSQFENLSSVTIVPPILNSQASSISYLPSTLSKCPSLTTVSCDAFLKLQQGNPFSGPIEYISEKLFNHPSLTTLNCQNQQLLYLPKIVENTSCTYLFTSNPLRETPSWMIQDNENLIHFLTISLNNFESIAEGLPSLLKRKPSQEQASIIRIWMATNQSALEALEELSLDFRSISTPIQLPISEILHYFPALKKIAVIGCSESIIAAFNLLAYLRLFPLEELSFLDCQPDFKIKSLLNEYDTSHQFAEIRRTEILSGVKISILDHGLRKLKKLKISGYPLGNLMIKARLLDLESLDLSNSQLTDIRFCGNPRQFSIPLLKELNLSNNLLTKISSSQLPYSQHPLSLDIRNNPLLIEISEEIKTSKHISFCSSN